MVATPPGAGKARLIALPNAALRVWCASLHKLSSGQLVHPEPFDQPNLDYPEGYLNILPLPDQRTTPRQSIGLRQS
jgi:hypothetical protein